MKALSVAVDTDLGTHQRMMGVTEVIVGGME